MFLDINFAKANKKNRGYTMSGRGEGLAAVLKDLIG